MFAGLASPRAQTAAEASAGLTTRTRIPVAAVPMLTATDEVDCVVTTRARARVAWLCSVGRAANATEATVSSTHAAAQAFLSLVGALQGAFASASEFVVRRSARGALVLAIRRVSGCGFTRYCSL
jgi:hypothetical protein